jgi:fatty-acyl-CoA synthase
VVGLLGHNRRAFVEATVAVAAVGADLVFLNASFAGPQLGAVARGERLDLLLHDDDLAEVAAAADVRRLGTTTTSALAGAEPGNVRPPRRPGRMVILTSGTTGRPKGASRGPTGAIEGTAALLARIPLRPSDRTVIAPPLFHAWGLGHLLLGLSMGSCVVLRRRFEPEVSLADVAAHRATVLVVVPVMLQRILALGGDVLARHDTSSLRVIASSGSAIPGAVVTEVLDRFGPVLYNVYGSTEVATATVAAPDDLRRSPTTAGRVAPGVTVRILDAAGDPLPAGVTGRVFVGNAAGFEGYTGGGDKERRAGLISSGDLGHFDARGLLHIDGRDDDMIVSGGENVFPSEVEDLLAAHPHIAEAAVVGEPDDEFGQVLAAFVVVSPGAELSAEEVRAHVRDRLARYKVPKRVTFLEELPRTPTGKVVKARLA